MKLYATDWAGWPVGFLHRDKRLGNQPSLFIQLAVYQLQQYQRTYIVDVQQVNEIGWSNYDFVSTKLQ